MNKLKTAIPMVVKLANSAKTGINSLVIKEVGKDYHKVFYNEIVEYAKADQGYGVNEFANAGMFEKFISKHKLFGGFDGDSHDLLGMFTIYPTPWSRSQEPWVASSYVMTTKTNAKIGRALLGTCLQMGPSMGYRAFVARTADSNHLMKNMLKKALGIYPLGVIPYGLNMNSGWVEELFYMIDLEFTGKTSVAEWLSNPKSIPTPSKPPVIDSITPDSWDIDIEAIPVAIPGEGSGMLQKATTDQKLEIEMLIHSAAQKGDGYALDEFTPEGLFNRKFFQKSVTLALTNGIGDLQGYMIIGPTLFCRDAYPVNLHAYIGVKQKDRALEEELFRQALVFAKQNDFIGIVTDLFVNDTSKLLALRSLGFQQSASIPYCAYVKGLGYSDSYVLFKSAWPRVVDKHTLGLESDLEV